MLAKRLAAAALSLTLAAGVWGCATEKQPAPASGGSNSSSSASSAKDNSSSEGTGEKTVITVLRPGDEEKVKSFMEPAAKEFNANHPDIEMQPLYEGWNSWIEKYPTYFQSNTQPDVVLWWDYALSDTYAKDKLVPIEDYVDSSVIELFPESVIESIKLDGVLYTIPVGVTGFMTYYNKDIFQQAGLDPEKPPANWDELYDYAKQISDNTPYAGLGFPGKGTDLHNHMLLFLFQSLGGQIIDDNNHSLINTPEGIRAIEYAGKLTQVAPSTFIEMDRGDCRTAFINGELGMIVSDSTWAIPALQAKFGDNLDDSIIGLADIFEGPAGKYNYFGADGWAITNKDKAEAAGKVVTFLSTPEQTYAHHKAYGGTPYTEYERTQPEFQYKFWDVFIDTLENNTMVPRTGKTHPGAGAFEKELFPVWQKYLLGQNTAEECALEAEATIHNINKRFSIS